ncbi:hypothetical protein [Geomesophilobacter sediminis]|uniref:Acetolactate decarboxylase n=1 Tax=Geomesophilobacter sediminis TaxID=2798584 RepID=A0A8J7JED2_9BACT|nr:hypothetical protein [Geomesophilobacter sediminis]MBJ6724374.1 hypothetical protein [Geomesophilobacter sediminis]
MMGADETLPGCSLGSCSCRSGSGTAGAGFEVKWEGAQRDVLGGDIRGVVDLEPLEGLSSLYALGPLAEVKGEVTIVDSRPHIARVLPDGDLEVEESFLNRACFLVYSQVARWRLVNLPAGIVDETGLEQALPRLAAQYGINSGRPFPFLLRGAPDLVVFHVLNKTDGLPHSPERHEAAKVSFTLRGDTVAIIGFHSLDHRGIFTPAKSAIHMHLASEDGRVSGHVDELSIAPGLRLYLPFP